MIKLVLERNIFRFREKYYTQKKGTCMGTPMAPNYANLFMDKLERKLLESFKKKTGKEPLCGGDISMIYFSSGMETKKAFQSSYNLLKISVKVKKWVPQ